MLVSFFLNIQGNILSAYCREHDKSAVNPDIYRNVQVLLATPSGTAYGRHNDLGELLYHNKVQGQ